MTLPGWVTASSFTRWQKRWIKRFLLMALVSVFFSPAPILMVSTEMFLLGHWHVAGKLWRRARNTKVVWKPRTPRPSK